MADGNSGPRAGRQFASYLIITVTFLVGATTATLGLLGEIPLWKALPAAVVGPIAGLYLGRSIAVDR